LKDELNQYETRETNEAFLELIRLLEEDGVSYVDEFPIELNAFAYKNEEDYMKEQLNPIDKVVEIIIENKLLGQVLKTYYISDEYEDHFKFITANIATNILRNKGIEVPIDIEIDGNKLNFTFDEDEDIKSWKSQHKIPSGANPHESLRKLIGDDKDVIRKLADNSISSKLILEILEERGLEDNIITEDYSISYQKDYLNQKRMLMKSYPEVTMETTAKEDFINLFKENSLKGFLGKVIKDGEKKIIPGEILIEELEEKDIDVPIEITEGEEKDTKTYTYTGNKDIKDKDPLDMLIDYAEENSVLDKFIISKDIRSYAQTELLNDGINPRISISDEFEYMAINNLNDFYEKNGID